MSDKLNIASKKGYSFKLKELPDTYEEFKEFAQIFLNVFDITFTLEETKFNKFEKYVDEDSIEPTMVFS